MIDIPQRVSVSWVYELPFGSGGKLVTSIPVVSQLIGRWQVSGVAQFQVGYPYNVTQTNTLGLFSPIQYPNAVGDPNLSNRTANQWFNTQAFQIAPPDTLGNAPRASFFGPGQENFDIGVSRIFPLKERFRFQLRGEFENAFNHPLFNNLNTSITSPAFGQVTSATDSRVIQLVGRLQF
ncbi:MAG TPA: hypothetical protein VKV15_00240 [Bryobacteraceae bacterium]|nr:hypothetical protein [Bryobacteraceae bacterium]